MPQDKEVNGEFFLEIGSCWPCDPPVSASPVLELQLHIAFQREGKTAPGECVVDSHAHAQKALT